jgi:hypothetical protein
MLIGSQLPIILKGDLSLREYSLFRLAKLSMRFSGKTLHSEDRRRKGYI